ncbi:MAG: ABC transporter permease [Chloroflexota bacterium]
MTYNPQTYWVQLYDVTLMQLTNWRWAWKGILLGGTFIPLLTMIAFGFFAADNANNAILYVYTGNIVMALMFAHQGRVTSNFAYMRATGTLGYFATLPIQRSVIVWATLLSFFVIFLPALILIIFLGAWLLNIPLNIHPLIFLVAPIATTPLAALGALIGTTARRPESAMEINRLLTLVLLFIGPIYTPPETLPNFLIVLGRFSPATYVSSALQQVLVGPVTNQLWMDMLALLGFTIVSLAVVLRFMDWRE